MINLFKKQSPYFEGRGISIHQMHNVAFAALLVLLFSVQLKAQKHVESLDRGLVAVRVNTSKVFVSWRMLGTDPTNVSFNLYRNGVLLNSTPISNSTNYEDNTSASGTYSVRPIINGSEQEASKSVGVWSQQYLTLNLNRPAGGTTPDGVSYTYSPNDCSVGDLDGDGDYEIIVKWDPSNSKDNSQSGYTGNVYLDAYTLEGNQLWRIDLGRNIRAGAHYTQFMVYDLDSDGRAEVACKTADGTIDGRGNVIGSSSADYRNSRGYILSGPEYLTIFNGLTGAAMATTNYLPARGSVSSWGDSYGNRVDRFLGGIAYLDGTRPSLLMCRGYYTRSVLVAWDWRNGQLTRRWTFDSNSSGNSAYAGQGAHSLTVGDVDNDGRDEIVYGAATIDDNGTGLYSTRLGHGDALHMSDMNPDRPGQEIFMVHEEPGSYGSHGVEMHDAATGQILWSQSGGGTDVGRGVAMDIDPRYRGYESWASRGSLAASNGQIISSSRPSPINFAVWWDGDLIREILDDTKIDKWDYNNSQTSRLLTAYNYGAASNNTTKATPSLSADLLGDWREEVIWRHNNNQQLLIFTTTIPTTNKQYTLMHDTQYRTAVAWQNSGYNQPPHPGFFLGYGMAAAPVPNIVAVGGDSSPFVQLSAEGSNNAIELNWSSLGIANSYQIYRDTDADPSGRVRIATVSNSYSNYIDNSVENGNTYYYWVKTVDTSGNTINSNVASATAGANVSAGVYIIKSKMSNMVLDVAGNSTASGANVQQWGYAGQTNQQWQVTPRGDGYYSIIAVHSGKGFDIAGASQDNGGNLQQWGAGEEDWQQVALEAVDDTYFKIVAKHSGKCLDVYEHSLEAGANIVQWDCHDADNQLWSFESINGVNNARKIELDNSSENLITFYPNPSDKMLHLQLSGSERSMTFSIIDVNGKEVKIGTLNSEHTQIAVAELNAGVYTIIIKDEHVTEHHKLVINH